MSKKASWIFYFLCWHRGAKPCHGSLSTVVSDIYRAARRGGYVRIVDDEVEYGGAQR